VIQDDAILLARLDGIGLDHARPLDLEEQSAGPARARDDGLAQGGLGWVKLIVVAQHVQNVGSQLVERLETNNGIHRRKHCLRMIGAGGTTASAASSPSHCLSARLPRGCSRAKGFKSLFTTPAPDGALRRGRCRRRWPG